MSEVKKHKHSIYDTDPHFKIDPVTRKINTDSKKVTIMQYDHNAERYTFELPRFIEGHDMLLCDQVQVHWINTGGNKTEWNSDIYEVDDFQVSPDSDDVAICSWLVSGNATQLAGGLNFVLVFKCTEEDETVYRWATEINNMTTIKSGIDNGEAIVIQYSDLIQEWYDRIFGTGESVMNDIEAAKLQAIQMVEETVPGDYSELISDVYDLKSGKANVIEGEEIGESITVSDASDNTLMGLRIFGKTTQAATPTPDAPQDLVNIENPTVGIYGKNICAKDLSIGTENVTIANFGKDVHFDALTFSIYLENASVTSNGSAFINFQTSNNTNRYVTCGEVGMVNGTSYTKRIHKTVEDVTCRRIICYFKSNEYGKWSGIVKNAQLEIGTNVTDYEPHVEEQQITLQTPNGLPGIPTTDESIATYRDENGILWIADEIDCERGVYIKRSKKFDLGSISNWTHQTSWSNANAFFATSAIPDAIAVSGYTTKASIMCNRLYTSQPNSIANSEKNAIAQGGDGSSIYVSIDGITDVTSLKTYLTNNETYIMYPLSEPIETELTIEEIRAYRKLHTNKPNTTILNNAGATMKVNYGKDTKLYFDSLYNAIINGSEVEW